MIKHYEPAIPDRRHASYVRHSVDQMLTLRILLLACGYEDCNDIQHLSSDPALQSLPGEFLPAQNTLSRWENSLSKTDVARLASCMVDAYVDSISPDREHIIIDVDCTDDPTHGKQQGSLFHGYYWHYMYNQLFYLDGQAGQVILPVLRPGNVHSGKWNDRFLKLIIHKIRQKHPHVQIHLRADAGFSCPEFYECAETLDFGFCIGIASNQTLKRLIEDEVRCVEEQYVNKGEKYQKFVGPFNYQAESWDQAQMTYAKIESTGRSLNVCFFVSNYDNQEPDELYWEYYVHRGEAAENRIKEIKNMCASDRLSCHRSAANYLRLILSCLAYELLRGIRDKLQHITRDERIRNWNVQSIRLYLIKVAVQIKQTVKRVNIRFARGHPYKEIISQLLVN